ncbi:ABC transporter ATP-binding protein [Zavarzinia sp. CC-PAN008]|uniref:ABC transporter ATP-binding protein n=1 Tax=Zavarzinia sp. CC-PAN008 TaxID=3243332 RepID=UPI003F74854B
MVGLDVRDVAVAIERHPIVRGVSLTAQGGALIGLIGPNGVGKSTLIRAIAHLVPLAGGRVMVDGQDVTRLSRADLARRVAYLPQGQTIHWPINVGHLVALGRLPHLSPFARLAPADRLAVEQAMARTGVDTLAGRVATTLSGGERARTMLARALAVEAPILLADEPVAALDPYHQLQVMELLRSIAHDGRLVVAVLHDLTLAARFCDRVVLMSDGQVVADGPPAEVLSDANLSRAYRVRGLYGRHEGEAFVLPWRREEQAPAGGC